MRSRSSMPNRASSSLDLVVTMSCSLALQICLIIALSFRCSTGGLALSMAKSQWHGVLRSAHKSCTHSLLKERWLEERTGSSPFNFFQSVFTCVVVESSQPPAAESMSPRYQNKATTSNLSGPTWTSFCGLPSKSLAVPWHRQFPVVRVLEPTAFLEHPVLAAVAEDAFDAHSSATDSTWKLA